MNSQENVQDEDQWTYSYYVRGPGGRILAIMNKKLTHKEDNVYNVELNSKEYPIYSNERIGTFYSDELIGGGEITIEENDDVIIYDDPVELDLELADPGGREDPWYPYPLEDMVQRGMFYRHAPQSIDVYGSEGPEEGGERGGDEEGGEGRGWDDRAPIVHKLGAKDYELKDHLGNVLTTVSDAKVAVDTNNDGNIDHWKADPITAQSYYPFGMMMPHPENTQAGGHSFGFNSKYSDDELHGNQNSYNFGARMYDPRVGRWLSTDPLEEKYPGLSPFQFAGNSPMAFYDPDGEKIVIYYETDNGKMKKYEYGSGQKVPNNDFVEDAVSALDRLSSAKSIEEKFDKLVNAPHEILVEKSKDTEAHPLFVEMGDRVLLSHNLEVDWNPTLGLKNKKTGQVLYPYGALWHELGHIYNAFTDPKAFQKREDNEYSQGSENEEWTNEEEKFNITTNENPLAKEKRMLIRMLHELGSDIEIISTERPSDRSEKDKDGTSENKGRDSEGSSGGGRKHCTTRNLCCFVEGTKVLMDNGKEKNIEEISAGDKVVTVDTNAMEPQIEKVQRISSPVHEDIVSIVFEDGIRNRNTFDHSYYVKGKGWCSYQPDLTRRRYGIDAEKLEEDDIVLLVTMNGIEETRVSYIKEDVGKVRTYNVFTEGDNNNYVANGILVHNESRSEKEDEKRMDDFEDDEQDFQVDEIKRKSHFPEAFLLYSFELLYEED